MVVFILISVLTLVGQMFYPDLTLRSMIGSFLTHDLRTQLVVTFALVVVSIGISYLGWVFLLGGGRPTIPQGWEKINLMHSENTKLMQILPATNTITFFKSEDGTKKGPDLAITEEWLRHRVTLLLEKNPWLAGRLYSKGFGGPVTLAYPSKVPETKLDDHFQVTTFEALGMKNDDPSTMDYVSLEEQLRPLQVGRGVDSLNDDSGRGRLWQVTLIQSEATESHHHPRFALFMSLSHVAGDGFTFYKLYNALGLGEDIPILDAARRDSFCEEAYAALGPSKATVLNHPAYLLGLAMRFFRAKTTTPTIRYVCPKWIKEHKKQAVQERSKQAIRGGNTTVPFVSTNDLITSWFGSRFRYTSMAINMRDRLPSLSNKLAGNYELTLNFFDSEIQSPVDVRRALRPKPARGCSADPLKSAVSRLGSDSDEVPSAMELLRSDTALITNWSGFFRENMRLPVGGETEGCMQKRHLLGMDSGESTVYKDFVEQSLHIPIYNIDIWIMRGTCIIFRPSKGKLALIMTTRAADEVNKQLNASPALGEPVLS